MTMRNEIRKIAEGFDAQGKALMAADVVAAAKDALTYPLLNEHLWQVPEADLATEARIQRAHKLLISVRVVVEEGTSSRLLLHTPGTAGYVSAKNVVTNVDLAAIKLRQLTEDVLRSRGRLREFRMMLDPTIADDIDAALEGAEQKIKAAYHEREPKADAAA